MISMLPRSAASSEPTAVTRMTFTDGAMNGNAAIADDGRVGFVSNRSGAWQVWVMDADGSNQRQLTTDMGVLGYANWNGEQTELLFHRRVQGVWRLFRVDAASGDVTEIRFEGDGEAVVHRLRPSMNQDGTRLLYDRRPQNVDERFCALASARPDGSDERILTSMDAYHSDGRYSPDGTRIVMQVGSGDLLDRLKYRLYVMNADGSDARLLLDSTDSCKYPKWSPDGSRITYSTESLAVPTQRDVWVCSATGLGSVLVTPGLGLDFDAVWAPDGASLVFASDRFGGRELVRSPVPPN
ncbi:MAG TPA: hypothetical protein DEB06_10445 [Phycisphaerales bacterium]|nr:hypothetical protein [Phycisphaerales bacterium]